MPRLIRLSVPLILLTAAACADLGERAGSGVCPDEPCSPTTPEGLEFAGPVFGGAWLGDRGVKVTAIGGVQEIELIDHATGRELLVAYQAHTVGVSVDVVDTGGPVVTLAGVGRGSSTLRIDDDLGLLDQIAVEGAAIAEVALRPDAAVARQDPSRPWLVWAGAEARVVAELYAADGRPLVDQDMTITPEDGVTSSVVAWDVRRLTVGAAGATLTIAAGDLAEPVVHTVGATTAIDAVRGRLLLDGPAQAGGAQVVCFEASSGPADVVFVPWTFTAQDGVTVESSFAESCVFVEAVAAGSFEVTATEPGGVSGTVLVPFVTPAGQRRSRAAPPAPVGSSLGVRAGG